MYIKNLIQPKSNIYCESINIGINLGENGFKEDLSDLRSYLDLATDSGVNYIEIQPFRCSMMKKDGTIVKEKLNKISNLLSSYNFKKTIHGPIINDHSKNDEKIIKNVLENNLKFCEYFDSNMLVIHPGFIWQLKEPDAFLDSYLDKAEESKVSIGLENNWDEYELSNVVDNLLNLIKKLKENHKNVGMTLDFAHMFISSKKYNYDLFKSIEKSLPYAIHTHIHDNLGETDKNSSNKIDLHLPIGHGKVPFEKIFKLIKNRYSGVYMMEVKPYYKQHLKEAVKTLNRHIL